MGLDTQLNGGFSVKESALGTHLAAHPAARATQIGLRPAGPEDLEHLQRALLLAANWRDVGTGAVSIDADPRLCAYLAGWQRPDDAGHVATLGEQVIGAAWYRHFTDGEHGYGYLDADTPELSIAVEPEHRNLGVGRALLHALFAQARLDGIRSVSLSVEEENPAIALYRDLGFIAVARDRNALTMRRQLTRGA